MFHRIDDVSTIDGPRYFALAQRIGAYRGVMHAIFTARAHREAEEERRGGPSASMSSARAPEKVDASAAVAAADGWIEHVKEGG